MTLTARIDDHERPATPEQTRQATPASVPEVSSIRLVLTLGVAGVLAGLLLVLVFKATEPAILRNKAAALEIAVQEVLKAPARYETLYVLDDRLAPELPEGRTERDTERVFLGFDAEDHPVGFAVTAGEPGFQDIVRLIFGYQPESRTVLGMKVLESKETPGLGDKIEKDLAFVSQFEGARAPLLGVKAGQGNDSDPAEIDMITGATISSKAVIRIINNKLEVLRPLLEAYDPETRP